VDKRRTVGATRPADVQKRLRHILIGCAQGNSFLTSSSLTSESSSIVLQWHVALSPCRSWEVDFRHNRSCMNDTTQHLGTIVAGNVLALQRSVCTTLKWF